MTTLIFLHIPKTAGQTVHNEIERVIGTADTSPVRVHSQMGPDTQFPPGYRFYSGHLDWTALDTLAFDRFVFSILRDPCERIASFYFYLLEKANALDDATLAAPEHTGMRMIKTHSADDYFFGGTPAWQTFIHDHYDNFYCSYFATRKMRGWSKVAGLEQGALIAQALSGTKNITAIYTLDNLSQLEADLLPHLGRPVHLDGNRQNAGPEPQGAKRWPKLLDSLERDSSVARLEHFVELDRKLMTQIDLRCSLNSARAG